jgi:DNA helicase-2/ATP-dependent DNA helicase PcrA
LQTLPGDHPLAAQSFDGSFFALRQVQNFIGDCKRANLSPATVRTVLQANQATYALFGSIITEHWPGKMTDKGALENVAECIAALDAAHTPSVAESDIADLSALMLQELHAAQAESDEIMGRGKTKPFTAWKDSWLELDSDKRWAFKAAKHNDKLYAAANVYAQYQQKLEEQGMVDFNDQIVTVLAALAKHEELRLNLQERFQYIMIDEYQDTNRAQLQMARSITDAPVHEGRPNILVVGDDDQAIYRFQGADMSNIAAFEAAYRDPIIIRLDQNYRSNTAVLTPARAISTQISLSLEKLKGISKELTVHVDMQGVGTQLHEFEHETGHYAWIAAEIKRQIDTGKTLGREIAVLARQRSQLDALVPYLRDQQVPIDYERRENVLEQEHVVALLTLSRFVHYLSEQKLSEANMVLPEVISHPMWGIAPAEIWKVARQAHERKVLWLDVIFEQEGTTLRTVADFLFGLSQRARIAPLEHVLDNLIGLTERAED